MYLFIYFQPNLQDEIICTILHPQGNVESDVYSLFWAEVSDNYLIGTDQRFKEVEIN